MMYPFSWSIDMSVWIIAMIKHKFKGFSIPTGERVILFVPIVKTGKVESRAIAGPPPYNP